VPRAGQGGAVQVTGRILLPALLLLPLATPAADPSTILLYSADLHLAGDTLVRVVSITGRAGDDGRFLRNRFDFDPSFQSVRLLDVLYGFDGEPDRTPPAWAVDTLSGAGGFGLSLAVALPGLLPGMQVSYSLETRDWSPWFRDGSWVLFDPSGYPPVQTFEMTVEAGDEPLRFEGDGYEGSFGRGGALAVTALEPSAILWVSGIDRWADLQGLIMPEADSVLSSPLPPDLRGAVLEAGAAGADPIMAAERARTLLTESFVVLQNPPGYARFGVPGLQEILDRRSATPFEMAVLMCSICRELGLDAVILPVSPVEPRLPVPAGWDRFLVRVRTGDRTVLYEPSATLVGSGYVYAPDTLYMLDTGADRVLRKPPDTAMDNLCRESWTIDPGAGTFTLELYCRGYYDMILRRTMVGADPGRLPAVLSSWIWRGGVVLVPDSVSVSDLYDLSVPAALTASGTFPAGDGDGPVFTRSPRLLWNEPAGMASDFTRSWTSPGWMTWPALPGLSCATGPDGATLTDAGGASGLFLMMLGQAE
jgi:hypothetical protein